MGRLWGAKAKARAKAKAKARAKAMAKAKAKAMAYGTASPTRTCQTCWLRLWHVPIVELEVCSRGVSLGHEG